MKKLLVILVFFLSGSIAYADFAWETISGHRIGGANSEYGWDYSYDIGYFNDTLMVDIDIQLTGADVSDTLRNTWETGIETIWSTDRFDTPIVFNVDWVNSEAEADHVVTVIDGASGWNMTTWYLERPAGYSGHDRVAAHEAGHMFGLYDEYAGGAIDPETELVGTGGIMEYNDSPTLDYYYDDFNNWLENKMSTVPVPSTMILLLTCLSGFAGVKRKIFN